MIVAIGMDPGPTPGLVKLTYVVDRLMEVHVIQCSANCMLDVLDAWFRGVPTKAELYFQAEKFVVGTKSMRAGSPGARTRDMVGSTTTLAQTHLSGSGAPKGSVVIRTASETKAWASNGRLEAAGIFGDLKGMTHAKDAGRHALYTACKDGLIPDPFSIKAKRR